MREADLQSGLGRRRAAPGAVRSLSSSAADPAADEETELKLTCSDPAGLAALAAAPVLATAGGRRTRRLVSTYYDTPAQTLFRAGYTLRVREDAGCYVVTVKAKRGPGLTRFEREEKHSAATVDRASLQRLLPADLLDELDDAPLRPVFVTRIEREEVTLDFAGASIEVAMDRGQVIAGERAEPVVEVELELKRGPVAALYQLALELSAQVALMPSAWTKSDRGFALLLGSAGLPGPEANDAFHLRRRMSRDAALAAIFTAALALAVDHLPRAADPRDPEGVHQIRVALRRIRVALWLVQRGGSSARAGELSAEAGWLANELGRAREWDVLATETLPAAAGHGLESDGFRELAERVEPHRRQAHAQAAAAVATPRAGHFLLDLGLWMSRQGWRDGAAAERGGPDGPAGKLAQDALAAAHRKVLRRGRAFGRLDAEGRHRLRVALKTLRYTSDMFLPLVQAAAPARRHAARLRRLQEDLGRQNDACRSSDLLGRLADTALSPAANRALGVLLGIQDRERSDAEAALRRDWSEFKKTFDTRGKRRKRRR